MKYQKGDMFKYNYNHGQTINPGYILFEYCFKIIQICDKTHPFHPYIITGGYKVNDEFFDNCIMIPNTLKSHKEATFEARIFNFKYWAEELMNSKNNEWVLIFLKQAQSMKFKDKTYEKFFKKNLSIIAKVIIKPGFLNFKLIYTYIKIIYQLRKLEC